MRLIVTRPEEDALPTARALEALGHAPILAPLLEIVGLPDAQIPVGDFQAVLVTSANGVRAFAARAGIERLRDTLAVVVGPASAGAARESGFRKVATAEGDLASVIRWVRGHLSPEAGPLLYPSGAVTAGDVVGELGALGYEVHRAVLYEARPASALPEAAASALHDGTADGVTLYSPRTASIWARLATAAGLAEQAARLMHYCLSANVASAVRSGLGDHCPVSVAETPDEPALLRLMGRPA